MASNIDSINANRAYINISRTASINTQAAQSVKNVNTNTSNIRQGQKVDFKTLLEQSISTKQESAIVFSKHAQQRVTDRSIDISEGILSKLNDAVTKARHKGVKDALILNGDSMFIVNTMNNTVITALKGSEMKDNVFTNIDGTVII